MKGMKKKLVGDRGSPPPGKSLPAERVTPKVPKKKGGRSSLKGGPGNAGVGKKR